MKLTTKGKYGLRICFMMALSMDKPVPLTALTRQTGLSEKYLEQLLILLKKADVVKTVRGVNGGYYLAHPAEEISVYTVLSALGDSFDSNDCISGVCDDDYCPNKKLFSKLNDKINEVLAGTSLKDMIDDYKCI